jgi:glycine/serine hydroxymethyltransferase
MKNKSTQDKIQSLMNLALDGEGNENRSAALKAVKLIQEHGYLTNQGVSSENSFEEKVQEALLDSMIKRYEEGYKQALVDMKKDMSLRYKQAGHLRKTGKG